MKLLEQAGSLKGSLSAEEQLSLIRGCASVEEAVEGAMHIQVSQELCTQVCRGLKSCLLTTMEEQGKVKAVGRCGRLVPSRSEGCFM